MQGDWRYTFEKGALSRLFFMRQNGWNKIHLAHSRNIHVYDTYKPLFKTYALIMFFFFLLLHVHKNLCVLNSTNEGIHMIMCFIDAATLRLFFNVYLTFVICYAVHQHQCYFTVIVLSVWNGRPSSSSELKWWLLLSQDTDLTVTL